MFAQQSPIGGNKQVCSFYMKGTCKYGTQCWNLHPPNQGAVGGMSSSFGVTGNMFGAKTSTQPDSKEFTEFVKQVSGEMTQWERSGQWLLSSFAPLKSHPMLAGFSDLSPEELRGKAYEALKANTSSAYQEHWSKLQQQYKQMRDALRVPTPEAYQAVKEVFHAKGSSEQSQQQSSQPVKQTSMFEKSSVFAGNVAQPQPGAGLLGAKPQSSIFGGGSLFGANQTQTASLFGDASKKPVFGGPSAAVGSQATSTFGGPSNAPSPFGSATNSLFKSSTSSTLSGGSVFGGPPKIQGSTLFGGGTGTNAAPTGSGNLFGGSSTSTAISGSGNIFGGGSSAIAASPVAGNLFGGTSTSATTPASISIFGGGTPTNTTTPAAGGIFGGPSTNTTTPATGGLFGSGQNQASNLFGNNNQSQSSTFGGMGTGTSSSVFGASNTASAFGNTNTSGTPASVFGNKTSVFGGQSQNQPQAQQTTSLFGSPPPNTPGIFGAKPLTTSTQAQSVQPSLFGGSSFSMTPGSAFSGSGPNPSGGPGLFGNAPPSNAGLFGNKSEPSSGAGLFGKPPEPQQVPQANLASQSVPTLFGGGNKVSATQRPECFTPLDQLDPADKAQFEADIFTCLPLCAPPLELC